MSLGVAALFWLGRARFGWALDELAALVATLAGRERRSGTGNKADRGKGEHELLHSFLPGTWGGPKLSKAANTAGVLNVTIGTLSRRPMCLIEDFRQKIRAASSTIHPDARRQQGRI